MSSTAPDRLAAAPPFRSPLPPSRQGFTRLVRSELTKFRTVRGWVLGLVCVIALTALVGLLARGSCQRRGADGSMAGCYLQVSENGRPVTDNFYFVHRGLTGDGSLTVRTTALTGDTLQPWSKAGIIVKRSTKAGTGYAAMMVTAQHGVRMQYDFTEDVAGLPGPVSPEAPRWLRLVRSGDTLTGYDSLDGSRWSRVGSVRLTDLAATVQVGLFAASPEYATIASSGLGQVTGGSGATQAKATFDHVVLQGSAPGGWAELSVGDGGGPGGPGDPGGPGGPGDPGGPRPGQPPVPVSSYQQAGDGVTVSGSGDIAPAVPGGGSVGTTIAQPLVGTFAGLVAAIVVAVMFITAEYRRGLIRLTLVASPRRGRVLAAKAIVVFALTFVAGLVASAIAIPLGSRLLREGGEYVYPVARLTELRVMVGTACLMALTAVLALAVGAILRRSAAAVAVVVAITALPYLLVVAAVLPPGPSDWLLRFSPIAAFAIQQTVPAYYQVVHDYSPLNGFFPLAPAAGLAVLAGYAAAACGLAAVLLRRRDA